MKEFDYIIIGGGCAGLSLAYELEINEKLKETYANLNSWQKTQVARHEDRPRANFYIKKIYMNL